MCNRNTTRSSADESEMFHLSRKGLVRRKRQILLKGGSHPFYICLIAKTGYHLQNLHNCTHRIQPVFFLWDKFKKEISINTSILYTFLIFKVQRLNISLKSSATLSCHKLPKVEYRSTASIQSFLILHSHRCLDISLFPVMPDRRTF